jgi:hypothetical protein
LKPGAQLNPAAPVKHSVRALMTGLIDYAGLFPPASLGMRDAVTRYASYRQGPYAWMLGRFVVPCRRLAEFEQHAAALLWPDAGAAAGAAPWRLSALAGDDLLADGAAIEAFNARHAGSPSSEPSGIASPAEGSSPAEDVGAASAAAARRAGAARIDTVEVKIDSAEDVRRIAGALPSSLRLWFEVAPGPALGSVLEAIAAARQGAKLRTGGTSADAIPDARAVAHFLFACARAGVMCKATAGLHHPVHAPHRLTYADDSPTAMMHGFVNVFLAAALARELVLHGYPDPEIVETLVALLGESDVHRFDWHDDRVTWRRHVLDVHAIETTREQFARSFGSCSVEEPIEDLQRLGWL